MMGITRYMRILALFGEDTPSWTVAEISEKLETSASTLYRLVREMVAAGLLESTVESRYRLGPLFIEYYRRIRLTDPLVRSGSMFLDPLIQQTGAPCSAILARLYGRAVMCVAESRSPNAGFDTSYELGRPMPPLRGATSKAVLSTLSKRQIRSFLVEHGASSDADQGLTGELGAIRKRGICVTSGEVDHGLVGIASPVQNRSLGINASLSVIVEARTLNDEIRSRIMTAVTATARMIEGFMEEAFA
jgi:DNA-binding IclR family transcriptional regulator